MKKTKTVVLIAAGLIALGLIVGGVGFLLGGWKALTKPYRHSAEDAAGADFSVGLFHSSDENAVERNETFQDNIRALEVSAVSDNVVLLPSEDGDWHVTVHESELRKWNIRVSGETLLVMQDAALTVGVDFGSRENYGVYIYLPGDGCRSAKLKTVSGNITFDGFCFDETEAETVSGTVSLKNGELGETDIETVSGDVLLEHCSARETDIETTSGGVWLEAYSAGETDIETISGDVRGTVASPVRFEVHTVSGEESYVSDKSAKNTMEITTVSGDIEITEAPAK